MRLWKVGLWKSGSSQIVHVFYAPLHASNRNGLSEKFLLEKCITLQTYFKLDRFCSWNETFYCAFSIRYLSLFCARLTANNLNMDPDKKVFFFTVFISNDKVLRMKNVNNIYKEREKKMVVDEVCIAQRVPFLALISFTLRYEYFKSHSQLYWIVS